MTLDWGPRSMLPALALLNLVVTATGCEREPQVELPALSEHGTYVSMAIEGSVSPCGGSLPWMDRHVEALGSLFERSVTDIAIEYYWLRQETLAPECGVACTYSDTEIHSTEALVEHEIAHAVLEHWVGPGEQFFSEGVAVSTSDHIYGIFDPSELEQIGQMIGTDRTVAVDYPSAGAFVTYLIESWDAPTYLEFYARASPSDDYAAVAASFEQVFEVSLDETMASFLATVLEQGGGCLLLLPECGLEPLAWTQDRWDVDVDVACSADALGPDSDPDVETGDLWRYVAVDIAVEGTYSLISEGPPATFHHCGPCPERGDSHTSSMFGASGVEASLQPGRYVARLPGLPGADVVHHLSIEPAP